MVRLFTERYTRPNSLSSPSMDESQTKEELRPVKKQLVGDDPALKDFD